MTKAQKITYWVATLWLALGMTSTGLVQILKLQQEVDKMLAMGYPLYFLPLLGIWKILGVVAILVPKFPLVKEWAYAGFFFAMTGAIYSHIAHGDVWTDSIGPALLVVLTVVSWYLNPVSVRLQLKKS